MKQMMPVFGWSLQEKQIHRVRLPKSQIAERGIHPWLVDVFDPNPIVLGVYGMQLAFTRLRKFSLAYTLDRTAFLMIKDDDCGLTLSLVGPYKKRQQGNRLEIDRDRSELSTHRRDFEMHLLTYLGVHENPLSRGGTPAKFIHCVSGSDDVELGFENRTIQYANHGPYPGYRYGGHMLEQRTFTCELPDAIKCVFEFFADLNLSPIVFGTVLSRFLARIYKLTSVDFMVDLPDRILHNATFHDDLSGRLCKLGAQNIVQSWLNGNTKNPMIEEVKLALGAGVSTYFKFQLAGVDYRLFIRRSDSKPARNWIRDDFSVHQIQCQLAEHGAAKPQITASRIALWDLGHKQARWVNSRMAFDYDLSRDNTRSPAKMQLKQSGFDVADIVWHKRDGMVSGKA